MDFLAKFWSPEVSQKDAILELGCNCGANLNALEAMGYSNLSGIEINPHAIAEMRRTFPVLNADVIEGDLESVLPTLPDKSFGCAFSMAVLMHIHPSSHSIFKEIARVARKIVTIEAEDSSCGYVFPRNYRHVFERLGLEQVREARVTGIKGYEEYTARLFRSE